MLPQARGCGQRLPGVAVGHSLVTRTPRGARLTPAGEHALERIRIALGSLATARATMGEAQDRPLVRLGLLPLVGIGALGPVVKALQQQGDMPRLILRTDTIQRLLDLLVSGEVDAVVGGLDGEWVLMPQGRSSQRHRLGHPARRADPAGRQDPRQRFCRIRRPTGHLSAQPSQRARLVRSRLCWR